MEDEGFVEVGMNGRWGFVEVGIGGGGLYWGWDGGGWFVYSSSFAFPLLRRPSRACWKDILLL